MKGQFTLVNAAVPVGLLAGIAPKSVDGASGLALVDLCISDGKIVQNTQGPRYDLGGRMVLPTFLDSHVHLDKAFSVRRAGVPAGGLMDAVGRAIADSRHWDEADLEARMRRGLERAYSHGTSMIRTHLDSLIAPKDNAAWRVMTRLRSEWAGRIDLQLVALMSIERVDQPEYVDRCAQVAERGGVLGCFIPDHSATPERLDRLFAQATHFGLDVDFHVDETMDPTVMGLEMICDAILRAQFKGRVVAGHCCALSMMEDDKRARVIAKVAQAGVHVISLPHSNMFLQDRALARTPRLRGLTLVRELKAAGASVHFASDNVQDPFYPYGDYDLVEVFQTAVRAAHLDVGMDQWLTDQFHQARAACAIDHHGLIALGGGADLVILPARDWFDFMNPSASRRLVLRQGALIAGSAAQFHDVLEAECQ